MEALNGHIACMCIWEIVAGWRMTTSRLPASGTRLQQQKMIDVFEALTLPKDKTVIAVGHVKTGQVYATMCENDKCTLNEMAKPEQACLTEHWNDCPYLAMSQHKSRSGHLQVFRR